MENTAPVATDQQANQDQQQTNQPASTPVQADAFGLPAEEVKARLGQYDLLKGEVEQYKAQSQISPFANDFVAKINDLAKQGVSPDHLLRFTQLQSLDMDKIDHNTAIKLHYQMQNPSLTSSEIDELINYELGELPNEEDDPEGFSKASRLREIKAKMKANESKKFLETYKADLANVKNPEVETRRALETGWKQVLPSVGVEEIDVNIDLDKGSRYELKFKPELSKEQLSTIQQTVLNNLVAQGVKLDEQGLAMAKQMFQFSVKTLANDQLIEAIVKDARASAFEEAYRQLNTKK